MASPKFPTVDAVLRAATSTVGVTEKPKDSNNTAFGREYGVNLQPWCGIWIWWIFKHAQGGVDLRKAGIRNPAFTPTFWQDAVRQGWKVVADKDIRAGDVLFFDLIKPFDTHGIQHVELARGKPRHLRGEWKVPTTGGNTSDGEHGSQDNGGGVYQRERGLDVIVAAVRPPYAKTPGAVAKRVVAGVGAAGAVGAGAVGVHQAVPPATPSPAPTVTVTTTPRPPVLPSAKPTVKPKPVRKPAVRKPANPAPVVYRRPLRYGSTGDDVRALQRRLDVTPTGFYGRVTARKVRAVQVAADIPADDVFGPVTARAMGLTYRAR